MTPFESEPHPSEPWAARILPRSVRERVFMPAYYDLVADHLRCPEPQRMSGLRLGIRVLFTMVDTVRVGTLGTIQGLGRRGRVAAVLLLATLVLIGLASFGGRDPDPPVPYEPFGTR